MLLYNLVIQLYGLAIRIASLRNKKARQWVQGRLNWRRDLAREMQRLGNTGVVWVHCASYGEFEQGRPLIEAIRSRTEKKIVLSFFSPSGYEAFRHYSQADLVVYLPLDTPANARDFVAAVRPDVAIFVKYEYWVNFLMELKRQEVPAYLISATFKPRHPFFKPYGGIFVRSLTAFKHLFLQDENSAQLLNGIGINNHSVAGDTRFDRVIELRNADKSIPGLAEFKKDHFLMVAGSTWPADENLILEAFSKLGPEYKLIIAPHELNESSIHKTTESVRLAGMSYARFTMGTDAGARVLVLDTMGLLSSIYRYADCAYVGGGFNGGLHNTLEPAVYGIPVFVYGDEYHRYNEVVAMMEFGAVRRVKGSEELLTGVRQLLNDAGGRAQIKKELQQYFEKNQDASIRILRQIPEIS